MSTTVVVPCTSKYIFRCFWIGLVWTYVMISSFLRRWLPRTSLSVSCFACFACFALLALLACWTACWTVWMKVWCGM